MNILPASVSRNLPQQNPLIVLSWPRSISADFLMQLFTIMFGQQSSNYSSNSTIHDSQPRSGDIKSDSKKSGVKDALAQNLPGVNLGEMIGYFLGEESSVLSSMPLRETTGSGNPELRIIELEPATQNFMLGDNGKLVAINLQHTDKQVTNTGGVTILDSIPQENIAVEADPQTFQFLVQHWLSASAAQTGASENFKVVADPGNSAIRFSVQDLRIHNVFVDLQVLEKAKVPLGSNTIQQRNPAQTDNLQSGVVQVKALDSVKGFNAEPDDLVKGLLSMLMRENEGSTGNKGNKEASVPSSGLSNKNPDVSMGSQGEVVNITDKIHVREDAQVSNALQNQTNRESKQQGEQQEQVNSNLVAFTPRPNSGFLKADLLMPKDNSVNATVFRDRLHEIAQGILKEARLMIQDGKSEVSIKLEPESLGSVVLKVATQDGRVSAEFNVRTQDARAYIESALPQMREMLTGSGISMQNMSVNLMGNSTAGRNQHNFTRWKGRQHYDYKMSMDTEESVRNFGYNTMEMKI